MLLEQTDIRFIITPENEQEKAGIQFLMTALNVAYGHHSDLHVPSTESLAKIRAIIRETFQETTTT